MESRIQKKIHHHQFAIIFNKSTGKYLLNIKITQEKALGKKG